MGYYNETEDSFIAEMQMKHACLKHAYCMRIDYNGYVQFCLERDVEPAKFGVFKDSMEVFEELGEERAYE